MARRTRSPLRRLVLPCGAVAGTLVLAVTGAPPVLGGPAGAETAVFDGPVPRPAGCDIHSRPETGIQGEVPLPDRESGRSSQGYDCNLEHVGSYSWDDNFEGATWQMAWYDDCAYYGTRFDGTQTKRGVQVIDASDRTIPKHTASLTTTAMQDPWESLKVHEGRQLLAGSFLGNVLVGPGWFDVYDVGLDCSQPQLLSSTPFEGLGHEGNWAPDGQTYYSTGLTPGIVTAIDVADAGNPKSLGSFFAQTTVQGLGLSPDGNRMYLAHSSDGYLSPGFVSQLQGDESRLEENGLAIYDVSDFQQRKPEPEARLISTLYWTDGAMGQHALPITKEGRAHVVFVDEFGYGGPRIIDVSDERHPRIVSKLRIEIQMPQNRAIADAGRDYNDEKGGSLAPFTYNSHYCSVDREKDPTILACSTVESGLRVFDIRDFSAPREIAYFNPGGAGWRAPGGYGGTTAAYTTGQPRITEDGEIWFLDQDRGLYITRFMNGTWPFRD